MPSSGTDSPIIRTMFHIQFRNYQGKYFNLDTTDAAMIGSWLAEMFGLFPYTPTGPAAVTIYTTTVE
jgi:hypothetical protein